MAGMYDNKSQQMQDQNKNKNLMPSVQNNTTEASTNERGSKRAPLSRESTLDSITEEDSDSLEERLLIESFKSITDIFENGGYDEEMSSEKVSSPSLLTSASLDISEDADSLDEEVRQIMQKSEEKKRLQEEEKESHSKTKNQDYFAANEGRKMDERKGSCEESEEDEIEEVEIEDEEEDEEEESEEESVPTDTESMSESEKDSESDDEKTGYWSVREDDESSEDDFDLEAHINKLCMHTVDSDSFSESSEGTESEDDTQRVIKKVMRLYSKKYSQSDSFDSESEDMDDASDAEETDLEYESVPQEDEIEEIEVKDDGDDSSVYSSNDDTDSDFLDVDSPSISTASSVDEDFDLDGEERDTQQATNEEVPYLSEPSMPSHERVYKHYLSASRAESCPEKIEVQEGELGENIGLDNTLAARSVINLRWPFTSYYVKEFDLDTETPAYEEDGLLPCYKSMKSSASFPGRRRDVMSGRVWWVEWWAKDVIGDVGDDHNKPEETGENLEEVEEMGHFQKE